MTIIRPSYDTLQNACSKIVVLFAVFCVLIIGALLISAEPDRITSREASNNTASDSKPKRCGAQIGSDQNWYLVPSTYSRAQNCGQVKPTVEIGFYFVMPDLDYVNEAIETPRIFPLLSTMPKFDQDGGNTSYIILSSFVRDGSLRNFPADFDTRIRLVSRFVCKNPLQILSDYLQKLDCTEGNDLQVMRYYVFKNKDLHIWMRCLTDKATSLSGSCQSNIWYQGSMLRAFVEFPAAVKNDAPIIGKSALSLLERWKY